MKVKTGRKAKDRDPAQLYRDELPHLLMLERTLNERITSHVRVIADLAEATAHQVREMRRLREGLEGIAGLFEFDMPASGVKLPDVDPDGKLWDALANDDAPAVALYFGRLAGALIERETR